MKKWILDPMSVEQWIREKRKFVSESKVLEIAALQDFSKSTGDHQWIHVDVEKTKSESPWGVPIAHGFWTLSRSVGFFFDLFDVRSWKQIINYGCEKVRFLRPLPVGGSFRACFEVLEWTQKADGQYDLRFKCTMEASETEKPYCVAEMIFRFYGVKSDAL